MQFLKPSLDKIILTPFIFAIIYIFFGAALLSSGPTTLCIPYIPGLGDDAPTPTPEPYSLLHTIQDLPNAVTYNYNPCNQLTDSMSAAITIIQNGYLILFFIIAYFFSGFIVYRFNRLLIFKENNLNIFLFAIIFYIFIFIIGYKVAQFNGNNSLQGFIFDGKYFILYQGGRFPEKIPTTDEYSWYAFGYISFYSIYFWFLTVFTYIRHFGFNKSEKKQPPLSLIKKIFLSIFFIGVTAVFIWMTYSILIGEQPN